MADKIDVLYNDTCPICSREVAQYARLSEDAARPISFDGISDARTLKDWAITPEDAAKRFHVRKGGQIYAGLPAFIVLWDDIPKTRWLARVFSTPGIYGAAAWVYDRIAAPLLYHLHVRRQSRD